MYKHVTRFEVQWHKHCKSHGEVKVAAENVNPNQNNPRIVEIGEMTFESEVLKSKLPVLAEFSAAWSRPCHILDSVLDEVASACAPRVKVVRINADDNPELSLWYDVQSIPTLLYFVAGNLRARFVGTASKEAILAKLQAVSQGGDASSLTSFHKDEHEHQDV